MSGKSKNRSQHQVMQQRTTSVEQHVWNYPAPPPHILEQYRQSDPRFADQFLSEWKSEADHRRAMESESLAQRALEVKSKDNDIRSAHRFDMASLVLSFILILVLLAATIWFAFQGQPIQAIGGLVGTLALFYYKKQKK